MSPRQIAAKRKKRAVLLAIMIALATTALAAFIGFASVMWSLVIGYFVYLHQTRSDKALLWLRRFHQHEPDRLRFHFALNRACAAVCVPITVQDTSFRTSYLSSGSRLVLLIPMFVGFSLILSALTAIAIYASLESLADILHLPEVLAYLGGIAVLVAAVIGAKKFLDLKGYRQLAQESAIPKVLKLFDRIRQQRSLAVGTLVLKCGDAFWQEVVQECIRRVDVILIDVSDITDNVLWEIRTAAAITPRKPLLLACRIAAQEKRELPPQVRERLEGIMGAARLAVTPCIYYPAKQPAVGPMRGQIYASVTEQIKDGLDTALQPGAGSKKGTRKEAQTEKTGRRLFYDFLKLFVASTCGLFVLFWVLFGPYDVKNALEAATGSAVIAAMFVLPVLFWQWWKRRKTSRRLGENSRHGT